MKKEIEKEKDRSLFAVVFSILIIFFIINIVIYCFHDSDERRLAYQANTIELFDSLKEYQIDLKDESKFNDQIDSFEFAKKSKAYFNPKMVSNIRNQGKYVTMTSNTQMLCFAINQLVAGKEIDLRTYKKQYLGVINSERKGELGCQEYPEEPWYVIYIRR